MRGGQSEAGCDYSGAPADRPAFADADNSSWQKCNEAGKNLIGDGENHDKGCSIKQGVGGGSRKTAATIINLIPWGWAEMLEWPGPLLWF